MRYCVPIQFAFWPDVNHAKAETPVLWPPHAKSWLVGKDWFWEGLGAGGKGDDRGWDVWMASPTRWTWVWVDSGSWWWTGRPGVLRFMGSQRVRQDWETELNWTKLICVYNFYIPGGLNFKHYEIFLFLPSNIFFVLNAYLKHLICRP